KPGLNVVSTPPDWAQPTEKPISQKANIQIEVVLGGLFIGDQSRGNSLVAARKKLRPGLSRAHLESTTLWRLEDTRNRPLESVRYDVAPIANLPYRRLQIGRALA